MMGVERQGAADPSKGRVMWAGIYVGRLYVKAC